MSIFGESMLKKLKIGDLVSWNRFVMLEDSYMMDVPPDKKRSFGVVVDFSIIEEGNRDVAYAIVLPTGKSAKPTKIFVMSLKIESRNTI
tara:strand:+ start:756 stop:1022 length:267 start_codon:yes stop_codon:yes gene_type:complete